MSKPGEKVLVPVETLDELKTLVEKIQANNDAISEEMVGMKLDDLRLRLALRRIADLPGHRIDEAVEIARNALKVIE